VQCDFVISKVSHRLHLTSLWFRLLLTCLINRLSCGSNAVWCLWLNLQRWRPFAFTSWDIFKGPNSILWWHSSSHVEKHSGRVAKAPPHRWSLSEAHAQYTKSSYVGTDCWTLLPSQVPMLSHEPEKFLDTQRIGINSKLLFKPLCSEVYCQTAKGKLRQNLEPEVGWFSNTNSN
jgi:hypothetical protein